MSCAPGHKDQHQIDQEERNEFSVVHPYVIMVQLIIGLDFLFLVVHYGAAHFTTTLRCY